MSSLHNAIKKIRPAIDDEQDGADNWAAFHHRVGFKEARDKAAELAREADQRQEALETALGDMMTMWRSVCDRQDWDPEHLVEYAASAKILEEK